MHRTLILRHDLQASIKADIAQRTATHQVKIAALKTARGRPLAPGAPALQTPLALLAHGDSWFDYPLNGNDPSIEPTDIIAQLNAMGNLVPAILNVSHYGDATSNELSWPKQQRMIDALQDPANWLDAAKPDAILFSGGGDDVAGDQFCIFLDYANAGGAGLNAQRFQEALEMTRASYQDLFLFRDRNAPNVPIFAHCYDFAIPNGAHPLCAGPWLLPSLTFAGWTTAQGTGIVHAALSAFRSMLADLANDPANAFVLVDTQGTLGPTDWANELHPFPAGFKSLAAKFVAALRQYFGNDRI